MNHYIIVTSAANNDFVSPNHIIAKDKHDAFVQAYKYHGGTKLTPEEFKLLCNNITDERICELFYSLTGEKIIYFSLKPEDCCIDELDLIE